MERQLAGLKSFAKHVEKFLEQYASGEATAPFERPRLTGRERERHMAALEQTPGASSSSIRPPPYVQMPEPPSVPVPPIPSDTASLSDAQPSSTTHFSTVRSEVRAGAIRTLPILNSGQLEIQLFYGIKKQSELGHWELDL